MPMSKRMILSCHREIPRLKHVETYCQCALAIYRCARNQTRFPRFRPGQPPLAFTSVPSQRQVGEFGSENWVYPKIASLMGKNDDKPLDLGGSLSKKG